MGGAREGISLIRAGQIEDEVEIYEPVTAV